MTIRIPKSPVINKTILVTIGSALVTAAPYLPAPWQGVAFVLGGLLGGSALVKRPGDVKAGS